MSRTLPPDHDPIPPLRPPIPGRPERIKHRLLPTTEDVVGRSEKAIPVPMMTRSNTAAVTGRASAMRRLRRRANLAGVHATGESRTFCRTNGCASFLEVDPTTGRQACPICGYTPRPH